jgi:eukaryotic-like serine/threonine-protein kinase
VKDFFSFLKSKSFFKHFALAILILCVSLFLLFKLLAVYTNHDETVEVPDFKGQALVSLDRFVEDKQVRYKVIDSIYSPGDKPGVVVKQDPMPKVKVKHNRTVYLYVTSLMPPMVEMPQLVDRSLRQALAMIESYGLKVAHPVKKVAGECNGCVLKQFVDGKEQTFKEANGKKPKYFVKKGSVVQLVVGSGEQDERIAVPSVVGLTLEEALQRLRNNGLTQGTIVPDAPSKDSLMMKVYKQDPPSTETGTIRVGSTVDLYLTNDKGKLGTQE